ncbi:RteC domain-containing protein [Mucilaginibacter sp. BJC16-A38]|uniref:RteC domain-containing protein n=1 Tax=Mucilaginibacter phenanthrenivorans TaxID=1234842 RepID=UPI002157E507|nr:RteC domain-containing protein [Mucilaginibacter phenanthrenivorans]MCR8560436.1 RteC domain-containing protein [Mucilaginibacter phenanthrenivorans]
MEKRFADELYGRFRLELLEPEEPVATVRGLSARLSVVKRYLQVLREEMVAHGFRDAAEEVWFFKEVKPSFYCWLIYYLECFGIESGLPAEAERLAYYAEQLKFTGRFFRQNEFYFQYYKLGGTELDHLYFIRGAEAGRVLAPEIPEVDPAFGTAQDYLFSKFMAYEMVQAYLLEAMAAPAVEGRPGGLLSRKGVATRWTGDTCNLIEVVYGIYETRQVNAGEVDLSDLMDVFEQVFQVNLSRYFRRFTEIKRRKTISKTKFLDQMRDAVNQRIDDGDALQVKGRGGGSRDGDKMDFLKGNPYL